MSKPEAELGERVLRASFVHAVEIPNHSGAHNYLNAEKGLELWLKGPFVLVRKGGTGKQVRRVPIWNVRSLDADDGSAQPQKE